MEVVVQQVWLLYSNYFRFSFDIIFSISARGITTVCFNLNFVSQFNRGADGHILIRKMKRSDRHLHDWFLSKSDKIV